MKPTTSIHRVSGPGSQLSKAHSGTRVEAFLTLTSQNKNSDSKSFPEVVQKQIIVCFIHILCLSKAYFSCLYYIQLNIFGNTLLYLLQVFKRKSYSWMSLYKIFALYTKKNKNKGKHPQRGCWYPYYAMSVPDVLKVGSTTCDSAGQEHRRGTDDSDTLLALKSQKPLPPKTVQVPPKECPLIKLYTESYLW